MFKKLLLGAAAGLTVLSVGAGIAAAQSDDDTGTDTTVEEPATTDDAVADDTTDDTIVEEPTTPSEDRDNGCGDRAAQDTSA